MPERCRQKGFTLVELLVSLAVLALLAGVSLPYFKPAIDKQRTGNAAHELANGLKLLRQQARSANTDYSLLLDIENATYHMLGAAYPLNLPADAELSLLTASSELVSEHSGQIRFFHDGSSTGGQIMLAYRNNLYEIDVHWLTGHTTLRQHP